MRLFATILLTLAGLTLGTVFLFHSVDPVRREARRMATLIDHERARIKLNQEQADATRLAPIRVVAGALWLLVPPCAALGGIV